MAVNWFLQVLALRLDRLAASLLAKVNTGYPYLIDNPPTEK
jgi:hypothetical protein